MSSFLGDLVNSIGTNKAPVHPKPAQRPPVISNATQAKSTPTPRALPSSPAPPVAGLKRKLDDRDSADAGASNPPERLLKANPAPPSPAVKVNPKPISQLQNGIKASAPKPAATKAIAVSAPVTTSASTKPAAKGSYAQMIARAKEAQQTRTSNPLGTIKHQATSKEKISKLAERRRQEQEKVRLEKDKKTGKSTSSSRSDKKRGESPVKKTEQSKVPRVPRPPLHAPQSSYKGTMGKAAKRGPQDRGPKKSRYDEYLATDEEDNSDVDEYGDDDGYGYSDESSDMEAGLDDIDNEERRALQAAKEDDAKELAYEAQLKREKEERKRKLQAMARKSR